MLDSSSSRIMDIEYLVRDYRLSIDELNLLIEFEKFCYSNRYIDANLVKKMMEKWKKSDVFARIICKIKSQYPSSKYSLSSKSYHDSSKYRSDFSSSKSYHDSSKYHSQSSSSKYYHDSSKYYSCSSYFKS